jgi:hypothetical protein
MEQDEIIKKYFSDKAKKMHKDNPRTKEFYSEMGKRSAEKRKNERKTK